MKLFRWLLPFAFKKHDLAEYTTQTFFVGISLVLATFFALLFLHCGGVWMYFSIPFWGLLLYDLLAALFSTLCFFEIVAVSPAAKQASPKKVKSKSQEKTDSAPAEETPSVTE